MPADTADSKSIENTSTESTSTENTSPESTSSERRPLDIVFCWHMHQPEYRDPISKICERPWSYLRAIKDYTDMAAHLEQVPNAHAVINFSPLLLRQIDYYSEQLNHYFTHQQPPSDPLLAALIEPTIKSDQNYRYQLVKQCVDFYNTNIGQHFEPCVALHNIGRHILDNASHMTYICDGFFTDLLVWFHLTWLGETVRRDDPRAQKLIARERHYSMYERIQLVRIISEQISQIIPRYRALAERQVIELAMTPYAHPIAPLLLDLNSARQATPHIVMPNATEYPGGEERLRWHIDRGRELFIKHFGSAPVGCWPAEGAIDDATLKVLNHSQFAWTASGAGVLNNSLKNAHSDDTMQQQNPDTAPYQSYSVGDCAIRCFFRDDHLSDLIGFTYSSWHGDDAVANLISHLEEIGRRCREGPEQLPDALVAIIMDGENAWEHYYKNGFFFLRELYRRLAEHPDLNLTTFAKCLDRRCQHLDHLTAGSWVYGNLTTWIGDADKNRAWDMLIDAKHSFDQVMQGQSLGKEEKRAAEYQLGICEGSDWFWWPGPDNSAETIAAFDQLFRMHLQALYTMLDIPAPDYLHHPFTRALASDRSKDAENRYSGVMRKAN